MRSGHCAFLLLLALAIGGALPVSATAADSVGTLSPVAIFERCYSHLTRQRVARNHAIRGRVARGEITPVAGCMEVFDFAKLDASGVTTSGKPEAGHLLATFNDFHRTWFPADNMDAALNAFACPRENYKTYDEGESALHFTRVLFGSGVPFKEAFTSSLPMEAIRNLGPISGGTVHEGQLLGVRPMSLAEATRTMTVEVQQSGSPSIIRHKESLGGGYMGTRSYLALTIGAKRVEQKSDGGIDMARRWAKASMESALCRPFPILRKPDVERWVNTGSELPFRRSSSCMTCHATMDSLAGTARNVSIRIAPNANCFVPLGAVVAGVKYPEEIQLDAGGTPRPDSDPIFSARPPTGRLIYRSFDGSLKDMSGKDLPELANQLVAQDDVYVCAAKRYFEYFTGISVNLQDIGDPELPVLSAADLQYRNQVIELGRGLKSTNSLRSLIQNILSSPTYAKPYVTR
jgi:hypothetical protein